MMPPGDIQRRRSLVHALATRELGRDAPNLREILPRKRWAVRQVLSPEDCAVLLGFSSDGNYLVYYTVFESAYIVQWKHIRQYTATNAVELTLSLELVSHSVGAPNVGSTLRIWQSTDDDLVAVITTDNPIASQDAGPSYHVTLSASPRFTNQHVASRSASLAFSYTLPSVTQELDPWQLLTIGRHSYLLVLNMGSSIVFLVLRLALLNPNDTKTIMPQILPHIGFEDREWYAPSEYPIEFNRQESRQTASAPNLADLQCMRQQEFDCETFLASFFRKYAAFRLLHLVDYDLQLVRTRLSEKTIFMSCTADLESTPSITTPNIEQSRLALFFSLEIFSGEYHVVRALKVPRQQPLRQISRVLARKFHSDLTARAPLDPVASEWNNEPVLQLQSLDALHNPRYPVSIYLK